MSQAGLDFGATRNASESWAFRMPIYTDPGCPVYGFGAIIDHAFRELTLTMPSR